MGYIAMWVALLLILKDFLSRFAFRYQDGSFFWNCENCDCELLCIIGCEIMGVTFINYRKV